MTEAYILSLAQNTLVVTASLAAPVLAVSLVVGILISLVQAATQINEVTMTFIPKMVGTVLVLVLLGSWMAQKLLAFTANILMSLPNLPR